MPDFQTTRRFRRIGLITIFAIYFLILVGGMVRASGAGMGCPDWPTCFGQFIPPTDVSQLPANYQKIYADRGYADTEFNPLKTWTEYLNRLTGVSIGLLIIFTTWCSRAYLSSDKAVFFLSLTVLLLTCFQGWLGAVVVASELHPVIITLHMLLALIIVALLIYTITRSQHQYIQQLQVSNKLKKYQSPLIFLMGLVLLQVIMGTQVREAVDQITNEFGYMNRQYWRDTFPWVFYVHRSFSALILFSHVWLVWRLNHVHKQDGLLQQCSYTLLGMIVTAIIAGIVMDRLGMLAAAQPIHLLLATMIFGMQFFIYIYIRYASEKTGSYA